MAKTKQTKRAKPVEKPKPVSSGAVDMLLQRDQLTDPKDAETAKPASA